MSATRHSLSTMRHQLPAVNKILCLVLLAVGLALGNTVRAGSSDYSNAHPLDTCPGLPTDNVPRFSACKLRALIHWVNNNPSCIGDFEDSVFEGMQTANGCVVMSNHAESRHSTNYETADHDLRSVNMAYDFYYACGSYNFFPNPENPLHQSGDAQALAGWVNNYLQGNPQDGIVVIEHHDGTSFSVTGERTDAEDLYHYEDSLDYDGAVLPTRSINHGRDNDPCQAGCPDCAAHAMPVWSISQPYLNLWLRDTPVFYKTSLGQEIAFTVNYKQRDTRPKDSGSLPTTGWNHNWYSYVHFDIPVKQPGTNGSGDTSIVRTSPRGVRVQANWVLTNDYTNWKAILYASDNSESYFSAGKTSDLPNQRTLVPMWGGDGVIIGFRLVHGDGSQDIYGLVAGGQSTYGIVERYGCVFDKGGLTNGMEGVWRLNLAGADTPHLPWQDGDDAATYSSDAVRTNFWYIQQGD